METEPNQYMRLHPDDINLLANQIADNMREVKNESEKLLNKKELAKRLGIPYSTLLPKSLPFHRVGRGGRKMYRESEVVKFFKR
ncbi:MAG: hypothetical protein LBI42_02075 [Chitinispirillales bacterium]|jgi:hypothetical protein|nr:hypothetical protein [Chitinispirillales bacterium]